MINLDEMFMASCACAMKEGRLKEQLDKALKEYNELFTPGSKKQLKLISIKE